MRAPNVDSNRQHVARWSGFQCNTGKQFCCEPVSKMQVAQHGACSISTGAISPVDHAKRSHSVCSCHLPHTDAGVVRQAKLYG